jgi:hypothetical protein
MRLRTAVCDRYLLIREFGRGGIATVYLAYDLKPARRDYLELLWFRALSY